MRTVRNFSPKWKRIVLVLMLVLILFGLSGSAVMAAGQPGQSGGSTSYDPLFPQIDGFDPAPLPNYEWNPDGYFGRFDPINMIGSVLVLGSATLIRMAIMIMEFGMHPSFVNAIITGIMDVVHANLPGFLRFVFPMIAMVAIGLFIYDYSKGNLSKVGKRLGTFLIACIGLGLFLSLGTQAIIKTTDGVDELAKAMTGKLFTSSSQVNQTPAQGSAEAVFYNEIWDMMVYQPFAIGTTYKPDLPIDARDAADINSRVKGVTVSPGDQWGKVIVRFSRNSDQRNELINILQDNHKAEYEAAVDDGNRFTLGLIAFIVGLITFLFFVIFGALLLILFFYFIGVLAVGMVTIPASMVPGETSAVLMTWLKNLMAPLVSKIVVMIYVGFVFLICGIVMKALGTNPMGMIGAMFIVVVLLVFFTLLFFLLLGRFSFAILSPLNNIMRTGQRGVRSVRRRQRFNRLASRGGNSKNARDEDDDDDGSGPRGGSASNRSGDRIDRMESRRVADGSQVKRSARGASLSNGGQQQTGDRIDREAAVRESAIREPQRHLSDRESAAPEASKGAASGSSSLSGDQILTPASRETAVSTAMRPESETAGSSATIEQRNGDRTEGNKADNRPAPAENPRLLGARKAPDTGNKQVEGGQSSEDRIAGSQSADRPAPATANGQADDDQSGEDRIAGSQSADRPAPAVADNGQAEAGRSGEDRIAGSQSADRPAPVVADSGQAEDGQKGDNRIGSQSADRPAPAVADSGQAEIGQKGNDRIEGSRAADQSVSGVEKPSKSSVDPKIVDQMSREHAATYQEILEHLDRLQRGMEPDNRKVKTEHEVDEIREKMDKLLQTPKQHSPRPIESSPTTEGGRVTRDVQRATEDQTKPVTHRDPQPLPAHSQSSGEQEGPTRARAPRTEPSHQVVGKSERRKNDDRI